MKNEKPIKISLPYALVGKLSKRIKEVGFDSITEYIVYVLEQTLSLAKPEKEGAAYNEEDEKTVRERLKELGYL